MEILVFQIKQNSDALSDLGLGPAYRTLNINAVYPGCHRGRHTPAFWYLCHERSLSTKHSPSASKFRKLYGLMDYISDSLRGHLVVPRAANTFTLFCALPHSLVFFRLNVS